MASFDEKRSAWVANAGRYTISIVASSRDIRTKASFDAGSEIVVQEVIADLSPEQGIGEITP